MLKKVLKINFIVNSIVWGIIGQGMFLNRVWSEDPSTNESPEAYVTKQGIRCVNDAADGWKKQFSVWIDLIKGA